MDEDSIFAAEALVAHNLDMQREAEEYAKRSRQGLALNILYPLDDGRTMKVKKVNEATGVVKVLMLDGSKLKKGQILRTKPAIDGRRLYLQVLRKYGRQWMLHLLERK